MHQYLPKVNRFLFYAEWINDWFLPFSLLITKRIIAASGMLIINLKGPRLQHLPGKEDIPDHTAQEGISL